MIRIRQHGDGAWGLTRYQPLTDSATWTGGFRSLADLRTWWREQWRRRDVWNRLMLSPAKSHTCGGYSDRQADCAGCAPFLAEAKARRP